MIIQRNDPAFWEVRTLERRVRRGELTRKGVEEHLNALPDVTDKATASRPAGRADRAHPVPRRPAVRITAAPPSRSLDDDLDDDLLDDDEDDLDDDDEDDLDEDDDAAVE